MKIESNKLPKNLMEITIEVEEKEIQPFLNSSAQRLQEKKPITGFRPGKASYEIVKQQLGESTIWEEALEDVLNETFFKAIKENKLEVVFKPEIEIIKFAPGNPLVYKAKFALLPKVKLGNFEKLKEIKRREIKITQDEIEKLLKELQKMRAKEILVEREIKKGDKIIVDIEMFLNNVPLESGQSKNASIIIGDPFYLPGFSENLLGLKREESKEFPLKFPENYYDKKLAGKTINFKVKINNIFQIDLPETNDQFLQGLGNFKTLEDLKNQLKENLNKEKKIEEEKRIENEIFQNLIKNSEIGEIPEILISLESEKILEDLKDYLKNQNLNFEDYLGHLNKTEEDIKNGFRSEAEKRVKIGLIIREVIKKEDIKISEEEIEKIWLEKISSTYNLEIQKKIKTEEYKRYLENYLIEKKVLDFLKQFIT